VVVENNTPAINAAAQLLIAKQEKEMTCPLAGALLRL